jgi:hypothetical protein
MKAFKLGDDQLVALQRDATPMASGSSLLFKVLLWAFIIIVVLMVFRCGGNNDCSSQLSTYGEASQEYQRCLASNRSGGYRTSGGSFGGYSSGGGHK